MKRYRFLEKDDIYSALNRVRDSFLAAKNGTEVDEIISGLLTQDEKLKIGRRILIAECLEDGMRFEEISKILKVGKTTILSVARSIDQNPNAFKLIMKRKVKVEKEYQAKRYKKIGGSTLIFKRKEYTGIKRKDIER
ncbi:MAG: hypothetical protein HYT09_03305 [Candidatus Levybacteria bacterium]|nr:hypothetical protein [Candidatus Levybacteria bacterium]